MSDEGPAKPVTTHPPRAVLRLKALAAREAGVARVGLTTTSEGQWAVKVWLSSGVAAPLANLEASSEGHPIVYEAEPAEPPVARPAYPSLGE